MDVRTQPREPIFSILNDNDCPSFVIRPRQSSPTPSRSDCSNSPRQERPNLVRLAGYKRTSSISSSVDSPPLLRYDSNSSKASTTTMDSSPSPITPAYNFADGGLLSYDGIPRQDLNTYIPSPSSISAFMDQPLLLPPTMTDPFAVKAMSALMPATYPIIPAPMTDIPQLPTPVSSNTSASNSISTGTSQPKTSPTNSSATPGKKNKYPCPYAQSHNCSATFTTSGHAARHGKKHTGEKGVHCPICNKAFTRKDNMKQHERTHKNSNSSGNSDDARRSKAAITKDALKSKQTRKSETPQTNISTTRRSSTIPSPLSEVTSLGANGVETPLNVEESMVYADPQSQLLMPLQTIGTGLSPNSAYPPLGDDTILAASNGILQPPLDKIPDPQTTVPIAPPLIRGFTDLDTLAQAAESFNPYYQATN